MASAIRRRQYVFTINLDIEGGRIWDPAGVAWDESVVRYVLCGLEEGSAQQRLHWQGYIQLLRPLGLARVKAEIGCTWAHLEVARGTPAQAREYCLKEESAVLDDDGEKIVFEMGTMTGEKDRSAKETQAEAYRKVLACTSRGKAMELFQELLPKDFVVHNSAMRKVLDAKFHRTPAKRYDLGRFNHEPIDSDILDKYAVVLSGPSGSGKTAFALAHFDKPLFIRHIDQLKSFDPEVYDGLVFDDMSFRHWPAEANIHLFDCEYDSYINCRYAVGYIPAGTKRLFTTNRSIEEFISENANDEQRVAIKRRLCFMEVDALFNKD